MAIFKNTIYKSTTSLKKNPKREILVKFSSEFKNEVGSGYVTDDVMAIKVITTCTPLFENCT